MAALEITNVIPPSSETSDSPAVSGAPESNWLYEGATNKPGEEGAEGPKSSLDANATEFVSKMNNGGDSAPSESEDDSDDDIEITIGEINKKAPGPYGMSFPPTMQPPVQPKTVSVITAPPPTITQSTQPTTVTSKRTIDVNAVGNINGVPIYDYDIDTMCEEKPWRLPGADLTDYFNYGFNEDSWKAYCDKQKSVRGIATEKNREFAVLGRLPALPELPKVPGQGGSIGVIGAKKEPTQVISSLSAVPPRPMMAAPMGMFPPTTFLPIPPQLAPPGLAPLEMRRDVKQEDGSKPVALALQQPMSMAGPLPPPTMFPPPGMPSMLPPPGGAIAPPLLLPPPAFSEESNGAGSSDEERRRSRRRSREHRREESSRRARSERSSEHRSRSRRSPRKSESKKSSRKSSRAGGEESRHRSHRDEERSKRSKRKKDGDSETKENGVDAEH